MFAYALLTSSIVITDSLKWSTNFHTKSHVYHTMTAAKIWPTYKQQLYFLHILYGNNQNYAVQTWQHKSPESTTIWQLKSESTKCDVSARSNVRSYLPLSLLLSTISS
jgi:hypothetical protein